MCERRVVCGFLFPPGLESPKLVRPGVRGLDAPAVLVLLRDGPTATVSPTSFCDMRNVATHLEPGSRLLLVVAFVGVKVLAPSDRCSRSLDRHGVEGLKSERAVIDIRTRKLQANRNTASFNEDRALRTELAAVGGVLSGFFPRPAGPSPSQHRSTDVTVPK